jgi:hypothetical protein
MLAGLETIAEKEISFVGQRCRGFVRQVFLKFGISFTVANTSLKHL